MNKNPDNEKLRDGARSAGVDARREEAYWREHFANRPSYIDGYIYDQDYASAYQVGYDGRNRHQGTYAEHEKDLGVEWERLKGESRLTWDQARGVIRDGWEHAEQQLPASTVGGARNDVMDGIAGADMAELTSPADRENAYWRQNFARRPGYVSGYTYEEDYAAAYRIGYEARNFYKTAFEDNEDDLQEDWERVKGSSRLTWDQAKAAMREAWDHIEAQMPVNANPPPRSDF